MTVDEQTVRNIAGLARIQVSDEEVVSLQKDLNSIFDWIGQLNELDTKNVEPRSSVVEMDMKKRVDDVTDGGYPDDIVKNAPASEDHFFMVPKVVE